MPSFESSAFVMKDSHSETDAVGASLGMLAAGAAGLVLRVAAAGESVSPGVGRADPRPHLHALVLLSIFDIRQAQHDIEEESDQNGDIRGQLSAS